jgi:hypothetical protein
MVDRPGELRKAAVFEKRPHKAEMRRAAAAA